MCGEVGDVEGGRDHVAALPPHRFDGGAQLVVFRRPVHGDGEPLARQRHGGGQPDTPARSGDECDLSAHAAAPFDSNSRAMIMRWIWLVPS